MKRYSIVFNPGDGNVVIKHVVGEIAATAALAALLLDIDYWKIKNIVVREDAPPEFRKGDEITVISVGPVQ